jgi:hypothetical protein
MKVTAYTYNAATHCPKCARRYFNRDGLTLNPCDKNGVPECGVSDREGNAPGVIFSTDENASGYCDTCGMAYGDAEPVAHVLSIDAWREPEGGWTWNSWHARGFVPLAWCELSARDLFRNMRKRGFDIPAGECALDDDGYNVVIVHRKSREPYYAIEYGSAND